MNGRLAQMLAAFEHYETRLAVTAERAFLARLEGGCTVPLAGYATVAVGGQFIFATDRPPEWQQSCSGERFGWRTKRLKWVNSWLKSFCRPEEKRFLKPSPTARSSRVRSEHDDAQAHARFACFGYASARESTRALLLARGEGAKVVAMLYSKLLPPDDIRPLRRRGRANSKVSVGVVSILRRFGVS